MSASDLRPNLNARKAVFFPSARVVPHGGNRPVEHDDDMQKLIESIEQHGQMMPGITGPHPTDKHLRVCYDGNRRCFACLQLNRDFLTLDLDHAPTPEEVIAIRIATALHHKVPEPEQLAGDLWGWMEGTGRTKADAAAHFGLSPGYVTKLVKPYEDGVEELIAALKAKHITPAASYFVAQLPPEKQREALPRCLGKKRDAVERICKEHRGKKAKRPKPLELEVGGVTLKAASPTMEGLMRCSEEIVNAVKRAQAAGVTDPHLIREFLKG